MNSESDWAKALQQFQQLFGDSWAKPSNPSRGWISAARPRGCPHLRSFARQAAGAAAAVPEGRPALLAAFTAAAYLLNARTLMGLADAVEADAKTKARIRFAVEQWMAAAAPSNFLALNAEAQKKRSKPRARALPRACRTCCTTCARAMCR
jgi:polyhydroxyalkanoate synthase